jgi:creatinine amidohydrolase
MKFFDEMTMKEFEEAVLRENQPAVIIPIGSVEEHGDHLPLGTDTYQPLQIVEELAKKLDVLIAPPVYYGLCNTTRNFPGTISIRFETLYNLILDIINELVRHGIKRIVILSGHAGRNHMGALKEAAQKVVIDNPELKIMVLSDYDIVYGLRGEEFDPDDGHAGQIETSPILAIRPELVKGEGELSKPVFPPFQILPDPEKYFPSGIMGDPRGANAEKGERLNKYVVERLEELIKDL